MVVRRSAIPATVIDGLRFVLFSAYAVTLLTLNVMHFERQATLALDIVAVLLWLALAADYVLQWRASSSTSRFLRHSLAYPIYLATIVFITAHNPWLLALPLIIGFVLQLRQIAAGHALTFALVLFGFITVLATAGMVYAEQSEPDSTLRDWPTAATWTVAQLVHLRGYDPGKPLSDDGIALSFILAVSSLMVAALLTAQLVSWVVGTQRPDGDVAPQTEPTETSPNRDRTA